MRLFSREDFNNNYIIVKKHLTKQFSIQHIISQKKMVMKKVKCFTNLNETAETFGNFIINNITLAEKIQKKYIKLNLNKNLWPVDELFKWKTIHHQNGSIITVALVSKNAAFHLQQYIRKKNEKINEHYYNVFTNCLFGLKFMHGELNSLLGNINYSNIFVHKNQGFLGDCNLFSISNYEAKTESERVLEQKKDVKALCYSFVQFFDENECKLLKKNKNSCDSYYLTATQSQSLRTQLNNDKLFLILKSAINCELQQVPTVAEIVEKYDVLENESYDGSLYCSQIYKQFNYFLAQNDEIDPVSNVSRKNKHQITQLNCVVHPKEEITLFCDICNKFLCWKCVNEHCDHNFSGYDYEGFLKKADEAVQASARKFKELKFIQKKLVQTEDESHKLNKDFIDVTLRTNLESISKIINSLNETIGKDHDQFTTEQSTFLDQFMFFKKDFRKYKKNIINLKEKKYNLIKKANIMEIENYKFSDIVQQQIMTKEDQVRKIFTADQIKQELEKIRDPLNQILLKLKSYLCGGKNGNQGEYPLEKKVKKNSRKKSSQKVEEQYTEVEEIVISDSDGPNQKPIESKIIKIKKPIEKEQQSFTPPSKIFKPQQPKSKPIEKTLQSYKNAIQPNSKQQQIFDEIQDKMRTQELNQHNNNNKQYKFSNFGFDEDELLNQAKKQQVNAKICQNSQALFANWEENELEQYYIQQNQIEEEEERKEKEELKEIKLAAKKLNQAKRKVKKPKGKKNYSDSSSDCMIIEI